MIKLLNADCMEHMKTMDNNSIDAIITDPPYGLSFMGKQWDYDVPKVEIWKECLRVLKPGGHLMAFAGTRTQHRMAVNIEDAGFEIRDMVAWVYGSGFPKSHNIGKAVDKLQGNDRETIPNPKAKQQTQSKNGIYGDYEATKETTIGNSEWEGWGTALKPALEPITLARKPFKGTVADNVLKWGTGGLNIDDCRVGIDENDDIHKKNPHTKGGFGNKGAYVYTNKMGRGADVYDFSQGRFPANFIHDGSQQILDIFPESAGQQGDIVRHKNIRKSPSGCYGAMPPAADRYKRNDKGSAARFFYCPKASRKERDEGLEKGGTRNTHPTVKPIELMRYLCRLITPPNGVVLDPFMGSGSTGVAAQREGFDFIGMELDSDYYEIAQARIGKALQRLQAVQAQKELFG